MLKNVINKTIAIFMAACVCASCLPAFSSIAFADENDDAVNSSAAAYNAAVAKQEEIAGELDSLNSRITEIESVLPAMRKSTNECIVSEYKSQGDKLKMVTNLFEKKSISDAFATMDAYNSISAHKTQTIQETVNMASELKDKKSQLNDEQAAANAAAQEASSRLAAAIEAREAAKAKAAEQQKSEASSADTSGGSSAGDVDWQSDKKAFVDKWAPRIDSYLSGSPTAGTGKYYAQYAWDNGCDPRWAPAISCVESSKGACCFRSHNAWGYGSSGYSSWEEGIQAITSALGGPMYGGYLTKEAAQKYCPPSWEDWYNKCNSEMSQI